MQLKLKKKCGWCTDGTGLYTYCKRCGERVCRCSTSSSIKPWQNVRDEDREDRREPCRVCKGTQETPSGIGSFPSLDEKYASQIKKEVDRFGEDTLAIRASGGLAARYYKWGVDSEEAIMEALFNKASSPIILDVDGKLIALHIGAWTGCFD